MYHVPVFVLTHHPRAPLVMEGGTTFHFVTEGIEVALERARDAAAGKDVRVGGGVSVIQQYLRKRLVDEMHFAVSPVLLGAGERLFEGVDLPALGYSCVKHEASARATHVVLRRQCSLDGAYADPRIAAGSIQNTAHRCPSGSARSREYMNR